MAGQRHLTGDSAAKGEAAVSGQVRDIQDGIAQKQSQRNESVDAAQLERGLDDRTIEIMKLLLFAQLNRDLDVVELLFHELDERTGDFRFVAVLSDGAEQYAAMPGAAYQRLHADVETYLYTPGGEFSRIDMTWAHQALELLHEMG